MNVIGTVSELRAALLEPRRAGRTIGLVPTMGALHDGHLSLMRRARNECDVVVVSLFVNPAQFNDPTDLEKYPMDRERDEALAADIGVDHLFAPAVEEVYPRGFVTTVSVAGITEPFEGIHRGRAHFDGVATVVTKLFNMVGPNVAYFGQKDAQQALVIRRLVRDLDMPVRVEICPTVREPDGLALSSRNAHLSPSDRARATALHRALAAVQDGGERRRARSGRVACPGTRRAFLRPDRPGLRRARVDGHARARPRDRRRFPRCPRRPRRRHPPDRQPADPSQPPPRGGDPTAGANHRVKGEPKCPQLLASRSRRTSTHRFP